MTPPQAPWRPTTGAPQNAQPIGSSPSGPRRPALVRAHDHDDVLTRVDGVAARVLTSRADVDLAIALLDRAEARAGVPLVDESERQRLEELADGTSHRPDHWHSIVAARDTRPLGYAGILLPHGDQGAVATGDVAVLRDERDCDDGLRALLDAADTLAARHDAARVQVWLRHGTRDDVRCAAGAGYSVERRLAVLARDLDPPPPAPTPPDDVQIRPFTDADVDAVVDVLDAAYRDGPDGAWDRQRFDARRAYPWFRPEDLLLAEVDGDVRGVHWTKRRGRDVGEVYNLAVRPDAQGHRLGALLLQAGLAHLADVGCRRVLLWVDLANERAVRLYGTHGFALDWEDLLLGRALQPTQ